MPAARSHCHPERAQRAEGSAVALVHLPSAQCRVPYVAGSPQTGGPHERVFCPWGKRQVLVCGVDVQVLGRGKAPKRTEESQTSPATVVLSGRSDPKDLRLLLRAPSIRTKPGAPCPGSGREKARSVRARLQSCRKARETAEGFSPCRKCEAIASSSPESHALLPPFWAEQTNCSN
jgi:hypothetical protein